MITSFSYYLTIKWGRILSETMFEFWSSSDSTIFFCEKNKYFCTYMKLFKIIPEIDKYPKIKIQLQERFYPNVHPIALHASVLLDFSVNRGFIEFNGRFWGLPDCTILHSGSSHFHCMSELVSRREGSLNSSDSRRS